MYLFKPRFVRPILDGIKTQTRRNWKKPRAKVGSVHQAKTKLFSPEYFCKIRVIKLFEQRLGDMTEEEAHAEGFDSLLDFRTAWNEINAKKPWCADNVVWATVFEKVRE